jgi:pSer/pThr/pTyr-binding forkhead associated (FHA) protein
MKKNPLAWFEDRIENLVEGGFSRLFAGHLHPHEIAVRLARAMEDMAIPSDADDARPLAPDSYDVYLNPADHDALKHNQPDFAATLAEQMITLAAKLGCRLESVPQVTLHAYEDIPPHTVRISAQVPGSGQKPETKLKAPESDATALIDVPAAEPPANPPQIIINGVPNPLEKPVIKVGRHPDNDIVVKDPTVSRHHAQLQRRFGRYIVHDLGSKQGTLVNGHHISEYVLRTGDVIRMGGTAMLFVQEEDTDGSDPGGDTRAMPPDWQKDLL